MRTVLWQAVAAEENLSETYSMWAGQASDPDLQQLFGQLAEEHRRHAAVLQNRLAHRP